ncbi:MAG: 4a-hydroxytetrahydrobiopterin dehydratase [bacterium]|nr:4a-hydroxytetrahydrobiopterin dehydratase [bacterium]
MNKNQEEIRERLAQLGKDWKRVGEGELKRRFSFLSFRNAVEFVAQLVPVVEEEKQYPTDICIQEKTVTVKIIQSGGEGTSLKDILLAERIEFAYSWKEKIERTIVTKFFTLPVIASLVAILLIVLILRRLIS